MMNKMRNKIKEKTITYAGGTTYDILYDTGFFSGFFPSPLTPKEIFPYEIAPYVTDPAEVACKYKKTMQGKTMSYYFCSS